MHYSKRRNSHYLPQSNRPSIFSRGRWFGLSLGLLLLLVGNPNLWANHADTSEPYNSGWSFQFDNDLLAAGKRDQDYTGGFVVTLSGRRATEYRWTPDRLRGWADRLIGIDSFIGDEEHQTVHALEWGTALFTPNDIQSSTANPNDRPYASLFFLNSTEQSIIPARKLSIKSGLTIGFLGLGLAESLQRGLHSAIGNKQPEGWDHQISDGGELTAKYALSFQKAGYQAQYNSGLGQEFNWTGKLEVGFNTSVGAGFNWRFGRINTPWWSFNPHQSEYLNLGSNISAASVNRKFQIRERYIYVGGTLNYNAYNAFLQGQFRHSEITADRSDVIAETAEIWGGVSYELSNKLRVDAFVRSRTRELDLADSSALSWGGLIFSRSY